MSEFLADPIVDGTQGEIASTIGSHFAAPSSGSRADAILSADDAAVSHGRLISEAEIITDSSETGLNIEVATGEEPTTGRVEGRISQISRTMSWSQLPQSQRGISLKELWEFYGLDRDWLEEELWRCGYCHRCIPNTVGDVCPNNRGTRKLFSFASKLSVNSEVESSSRFVRFFSARSSSKIRVSRRCALCDAELRHANDMRKQTKNLYEVVEHMIIPRCAEQQMSYVEILRRRQSMEELESRKRNLLFEISHRALFGGVGAEIPSPRSASLQVRLRGKEVKSFVSHWWGEEFVKFMRTLDNYARSRNLAAFCTKQKKQDPMSWCFWICAFCNNQFAIDHALGVDGEVMQSSFAVALTSKSCDSVVVVFDEAGIIYTRIWCAFELFVASQVKSDEFDICLANENGVISHGCARWADIEPVIQVVGNVKTKDAVATVKSDKERIDDEMERCQITYDQLDSILRDIASEGLVSYWQRRRAPILVAAAGGFGSIAFCFVAIIILASVEPTTFRENPGLDIYIPILTLLIGFSLLFIMLMMVITSGVPRCAATRTLPTEFYLRTLYYKRGLMINIIRAAFCGNLISKRARRVELRLRKRLATIAVGFFLFSGVMIGPRIDLSMAVGVITELVYEQLGLIVFSQVVAIVYMLFRDTSVCRFLRVNIEEPLFA